MVTVVAPHHQIDKRKIKKVIIMVKGAFKLIIPIFVLLIFGIKNIEANEQIDTCIQSFQNFAYQAPLNSIMDDIPPLAPWQIESEIPIEQIQSDFDYIYQRNANVQMSRMVNGQLEVWVLLQVTTNQIDKTIVAIYHVVQEKWEFIEFQNSDFIVDELFLTSDGTIWARTLGNYRVTIEPMPVLSKFNEVNRQFEFAENMVEFSLQQSTGFIGKPIIVLDDNDIFWIFLSDDGIYRYDKISKITEKQASLDSSIIIDATIADNGNIFFDRYPVEQPYDFLRLERDILFQFNPVSRDIIIIEIPKDPWPLYDNLLIDDMGNLWLGATGYRDINEVWHLVHPYVEEYFELADSGRWSYVWSPPYPMLQTTDGRIWYNKFVDDRRVDGIAWYNPLTGEGCQFTNHPANIIEDVNQELWLVNDLKLYKYPKVS